MLTRRRFLARSGVAGAGLVLAPTALGQGRRPLRGGWFSQGVISGDPTPRAITLWTMVDEAERSGTVRLEVARDRDFRRVVARANVATGARSGHTVKARVTGLRPHERYFYRFETRDETSPVGRFQTALPADSNEPVRFAFFSCADYTHGFYNAYELMAREDIDFVVNLGDYIYAEAYHTGETAVRRDRIGEARTLADYRAKYALYRSDPALRRLHARVPMISIWDDHEVQDNYAGGAPGGGLDPAKRYSQRRRAAAYRAFFEHMPLLAPRRDRTRIYRSLRFGKAVELLMLDERQYRADQPCGDRAAGPDCPERHGTRPFLGDRQLAFAKQRLQASDATWKVMGNGVPIMPVKVGPSAYQTFDLWHGYLAEREALLSHIRDRRIRDVVFVAGDFHTFFAGDVRPGESANPADTLATEFVAGSITSNGPGEVGIPLPGGGSVPGNDRNPNTPQVVIDALRQINPWVQAADLDHHGYGLVEASARGFDVRFRRVRTIKRRSRATLPDMRWTVTPGRPSIVA